MATAPRQQPGGSTLHESVDLTPTQEDRMRDQLHPTTLNVVTYATDGAVAVADQLSVLTKTSAGAYTLATPVAGTDDGLQTILTAGTDFAHVVTCTSGVLLDGSTGAKVTWTSAAFKGSSLHLIAYGAKWYVVSKNLGTIA